MTTGSMSEEIDIVADTVYQIRKEMRLQDPAEAFTMSSDCDTFLEAMLPIMAIIGLLIGLAIWYRFDSSRRCCPPTWRRRSDRQRWRSPYEPIGGRRSSYERIDGIDDDGYSAAAQRPDSEDSVSLLMRPD